MTSEEALLKAWLSAENRKTSSATFAVPAIVMSPIIVFGNSLVVLSVWKDPLKKLWSSPSNRIIISMAIADLLVGLVACPLLGYWGWSIFQNDPTFGTLTSALFSVLTNVSVGHVFLLTIDRFFALVTPLQHRVKVTNKRVCIATVTCWVYFVLFGCAFSLWQTEYHTILGAIVNLQIFCIVISILAINLVTLYRFHKYSKIQKAPNDAAKRETCQQGNRHCDLCISLLLHPMVHSASSNIFLYFVPP